MNIVIFGSSLVSSYWNGAATYYRGICKALHARGHQIVFVEPDIYDRQRHRDLLEDPPYAEVRVCRTWTELARQVDRAAGADLVAKCSGVGRWDLELAQSVLALRGRSKVVFWDVDAPATLAAATAEAVGDCSVFRALIPQFDAIFLYGGGEPVRSEYHRLGARSTWLIYNAVDCDDYFPVDPRLDRSSDVLFIGNRLPDREERVHRLFFQAAELVPEATFVLGGEGWADCPFPANVRWIGHVPTADHRVWNASSRLVLNINREAMARYGFSPPTRVFEAAGCASCVVTDAWDGIEQFFEPRREILVVDSGEQLADLVRTIDPNTASTIGRLARLRVLQDHTYTRRAEIVERALEIL